MTIQRFDELLLRAGRAAQRRSRCAWRGAGVALLAAAGMTVVAGAGAEAQSARSVKAKYEVSFAGVSIGDFDFNSQMEGARYTIQSTTSIKLLLGAYKWTGRSVSRGVVGDAVEPEDFVFNYRSNRKGYRTEIRFARGNVADLSIRPPAKPSRKRVPLKPEHLKGVMDPMSAIMAMTRGARGNPCTGTVDVFEGRVRFKLALEEKGQRQIKERGNSGQPRLGYVCRVRFTPIAGHKPDDSMKKLANSRDIEVVLRPVPEAGLFVPYLITVPTGYGTVAIASRQVEIVGERRQRIALRH